MNKILTIVFVLGLLGSATAYGGSCGTYTGCSIPLETKSDKSDSVSKKEAPAKTATQEPIGRKEKSLEYYKKRITDLEKEIKGLRLEIAKLKEAKK